MKRGEWKRVSRRRPCPVCGHSDWCVFTGDDDNPAAVICPRTPSDTKAGEAGFLHVLRTDGPTWATWRQTIRRAVRMVENPDNTAPDMGKLAADCRAAIRPGDLQRLAVRLGLSVEALQRLRVGWSSGHRAWTFPMQDTAGRVLGIRLRLPSGRKLAVKGGHDGLFLPDGLYAGGRLLVTEGPTDCAALLDLGQAAVGRPSCAGGVRHLADLARARRPAEVVIIADGDAPGQRGAEFLAAVLVAYCPAVRIATPPPGIKDARQWKQRGATPADVEAVIDAAPVRRLEIRTQKAGRAKL